jgi:hypothetical protein
LPAAASAPVVVVAGRPAAPGSVALPELGVGDCAYPEKPPAWIRRPTEAEVRRTYPIGAPAAGSTTMLCDVGPDGGMRNCAVTSETPAAKGFAAASLKLAALYRLDPPRCADGRLATGASITVPMRWKFW